MINIVSVNNKEPVMCLFIFPDDYFRVLTIMFLQIQKKSAGYLSGIDNSRNLEISFG